ncbi:hypothetical protein DFH09DRAFT_1425240 [Mycena vulgaris]|nr:hypothetical protein DFH09DRAFT_1425240 [Mycena vulgaris]
MSSSSSTTLNEHQLRALTRKEIQALAKKENIKPANSSSDNLIKRLLDKFYPATKKSAPKSSTNPHPKSTKADASAQHQTRSARLATSDAEDATQAPAAIQAAQALTTLPEIVQTISDPVPLDLVRPPPAVAASTPIQSSSRLDTETSIPAIPAIDGTIQPSTKASTSAHKPFLGTSPLPGPPPPAPSRTPAFIPPAPAPNLFHQAPAGPTAAQLRTRQSKVVAINEQIAHMHDGLSRMTRLLTHLDRTTQVIKADLTASNWDGYYLQHKVVSVMKREHALWDGTNVMPPGPARDAWHSLLDDAAKEKNRVDEMGDDVTCLDSDTSTATQNSLSSTHRKRQRDGESGTVEDTNPSKRRKEKQFIL